MAKPFNLKTLGAAAAGFVIVAAIALVALPLVWKQGEVRIKVRWKAGVSDAQRTGMETRFHLTVHEHDQDTTWTYNLLDPSTANIEQLVKNPAVDDTAHVNRVKFRPELRQDRVRQVPYLAVGLGLVAAFALFLRG